MKITIHKKMWPCSDWIWRRWRLCTDFRLNPFLQSLGGKLETPFMVKWQEILDLAMALTSVMIDHELLSVPPQ